MDYYLNTIEYIDGMGDGGGYDWSAFNVYKAEDGNYYWICESGCSCDSLEENIRNIADMNALNAKTFDEFRRAAMDFWDADGVQKVSFIAGIVNLLPQLVNPHA